MRHISNTFHACMAARRTVLSATIDATHSVPRNATYHATSGATRNTSASTIDAVMNALDKL